MTETDLPIEVPIPVRIATVQVVLPYRGEDDIDSLPEVMARIVDAEDASILDWRILRLGGQYLSPTTTLGAVTTDGGHYIEGSAFRE